MRTSVIIRGWFLGLLAGSICCGADPAPTSEMVPWPMSYNAKAPGLMSADSLLDKPAGRLGGVVVKDGHFYTGERRLRMWGVNVCFGGAFPTHAQADAVAARMARFGINAVRFHHMDMQKFPTGIWADDTLEKLSEEALDRLDYFIAALKKEGIYANLNLHVSRAWSRTHKWENADKMPEFDKVVDLFDPKLMEVNKQYAKELLGHVNAYTKTKYSNEPAIAVIEINNEDTMFLWGGDQMVANLTEPYAGQLQKLWNDWLVKKYATREKLAAAWAVGSEGVGKNILKDETFATLGKGDSPWNVEQHDTAKMHVTADAQGGKTAMKIEVQQVDNTSWHLQLGQGGLKLKKGQFYTVGFSAKADKPVEMTVSASMAHAPWENLGLASTPKLGTTLADYAFGFRAGSDEENGRVTFILGRAVGTIWISNLTLAEGGVAGLAEKEDAKAGTVARRKPGRADTPARSNDWFQFLQQTDEAHWVEMRRYLKEELGVKCPVTGTIGLGALGTKSQSKMDFVDAHAYWDHPQFPRRGWDMNDWLINNRSMVNDPKGATLWQLAATRVHGKPFTVTEYNHSAPNEWQAECIPMIAAYAALQDWDGIFLFAYSHNSQYEKTKADSFFDVEGNALKMCLMPMGARLFLGEGLKPLEMAKVVTLDEEKILRTAPQHYYELWNLLRTEYQVSWEDALKQKLSIAYSGSNTPNGGALIMPRVNWTIDTNSEGKANGNEGKGNASEAKGTGRFTISDPSAAVFVGFATGKFPVEMGSVRLEKLQTPFATIVVTPAGKGTIDTAPRLLISAVAQGENPGIKWNERRTTTGSNWGDAPTRLEVVKGLLSLPAGKGLKVYPLTPEGQRGEAMIVEIGEGGRAMIDLGAAPTVWYEVVRE